NRLNLETGDFKSYRHDPDNPASISGNFVMKVFEDSNGTLWAGTYNEGLNRFDPKSETFTRFKHDPRDFYSLSHNRVQALYEDRSKVLWIGTRGGGVHKLDLKPDKFKSYSYIPYQPQSLPYPVVSAAATAREKDVLWIGTDGGGLSRFNTIQNRFQHFKHNPLSSNSLSSNRVRTLAHGEGGTLWAGTLDRGLNQMTPIGSGNYRFDRYIHHPWDSRTISDNRVHSVFKDKEGRLWIGTAKGLNQLVPSGKPGSPATFKRFLPQKDQPGSISNEYIGTIYQDGGGRIWIGTLGGLNLWDPETGRFSHYVHDSRAPFTISSNYVHVIHESPVGSRPTVLWIGTEAGLNKFSPESGTFKRYTKIHGLPANQITGMLTDEKGNLWIGTTRGLSRFNPKTEDFRNYDISDGLPGTSFSHNACVKLENGRMFFGSLTGMTSFAPSLIKANPFVPPVVLTSFKLFNHDAPLPNPLWDTTAVRLSYKQNDISFEFSALDYTNWSQNRYQYKMAGIDPKWIDSGTRHFAGYPNLPPGQYTFRVRGSNNDGVWNLEGTSFRVTITPPFWQTWWFKLVGTLVIIFFILAGFRFRVRRIKERNNQLKQTNTRLEEQIRKRKKAEKELRESRERLHSAIRHASMVIWAVDSQGIITFSDGGGLERVGLKPGELVGKSIFELSDYPEVIDAARKAIRGETVSHIVPFGEFIFNILYSPLKDTEGNFTGSIGIGIDETERKRIEDERNALTEQLRHFKKLETIGTLAGGIAHDFNNILGPILGYTEMALEEVSKDNAVSGWLESVVEGAHRARDLVRQILLFGRREKQEYTSVRVQVVIEEALKLVRATFPATIEIHTDISTHCPPVLADPSQVHQVFMNLCINAQHAMGTGKGTLTVQLKAVDIDAGFAKSYPPLNSGKHLRLRVSDTGHGIDPETQSRLFEPFYTTKKPGEGTGMGLSTAHGIIAAHGGTITVQSEIGKGAEFDVYLPLMADRLPQAMQENREALKGNEHILLVDDEESMVIMVRVMMEQLGYRVTAFTQSINAFDTLRKDGQQFDLVVTDQFMPDMTGTRLSQKINALFPRLPVLLVSGYSDSIDLENLHQFGISGYLPKPFTSTDLGQAIRDLLEGRSSG
ncbi:MAG: response regulator, partial [bacterium]|nr:response regulator [bacterium]